MATENTTIQQITPALPSFPLLDRVAIVTGSSRGIGKAIAIHLASLGARVVINYISNKDQAHLVANEIKDSCTFLPSSYNDTPRVIVVQADVSEPDQVKLLFDEAERVFGSQVHILFNSAAIHNSKFPTIANTSLEDFDRVLSINFRGTFLCCKEAANRLKQGGGGRIIMVSSSLPRLLIPTTATYASTKAAVETMVKILAKELKGTRITANCIAPGPVATELFFTGRTEEFVRQAIEVCPHGRLGEPQDIAPLVGFLASDESEWINGQVIGVNGGTV